MSRGSRRTRSDSRRHALLELERARVGQRSQSAFAEQHLVDSAEPAAVRRVHGNSERAASRFIVPPAETTRSASAIRLCASTARSGTISDGRRGCARIPLLRAAGQDDRMHAALPSQVGKQAREERVRAAVVERDVRRRADDDECPLPVDEQLVEDGRVGLEVVQVVLLLEPRVLEELRRADAEARHAFPGIASGRRPSSPRGRRGWCWSVAYS